jgi:hypothetical protein
LALWELALMETAARFRAAIYELHGDLDRADADNPWVPSPQA